MYKKCKALDADELDPLSAKFLGKGASVLTFRTCIIYLWLVKDHDIDHPKHWTLRSLVQTLSFIPMKALELQRLPIQ